MLYDVDVVCDGAVAIVGVGAVTFYRNVRQVE